MTTSELFTLDAMASSKFSIESLTNDDLEQLADSIIYIFPRSAGEDYQVFFTLVLCEDLTIDLQCIPIDFYPGGGLDAIELAIDADDIAEGRKWVIDRILDTLVCFE
jgi:hypothetical protein